MVEVCKDLNGPNLDIILHSPGGSPEATASLVRYLRTKFSHIRVFVPLAAPCRWRRCGCWLATSSSWGSTLSLARLTRHRLALGCGHLGTMSGSSQLK